MTDRLNLRGTAWDLFLEGGRYHIRRLPFILDATGQQVGPNDIFANDQAALEFVEAMAERGNYDCEAALLLTREVNNGNRMDNLPSVRATVQQEDRAQMLGEEEVK